MRACKGAVLAILRKAYQSRSSVALVAFGGEQARVVLPPTRSIDLARRRLERLAAGGATPFADGLFRALRLIERARLQDPGVRPVLAIVSDGEANVPLQEGRPAVPELLALATRVAAGRIATALIDVAEEPGRGIEMRHLAVALGASYVHVANLRTRHVLEAVQRTSPHYTERQKSTMPGQGTRPTGDCGPRALTRRDF